MMKLKKMWKILTSLAFLILFLFAPPVTNLEAKQPFVVASWYFFCMGEAKDGDCKLNETKETLVLNKANKKLLIRIGADVNFNTGYMSDKDHFGKSDYWTYPKDSWGDCEDFALEKRHRLIKAGVPASSLAIASVRIKGTNNNHAILYIYTDKGVMILDNAKNGLYTYEESLEDYYLNYVQDRINPNVWNRDIEKD